MIDWKPIETAPLDRPVMITDGEIFGVAERLSWTEAATLGYDSSQWGGPNTLRPNPRAGQINYYWGAVAGWTALSSDVEWEDGEYEQSGPRSIEPTHWAEPPQLPERR